MDKDGKPEAKSPHISGAALVGLFVVLAVAALLTAFWVYQGLERPVPIAEVLGDLRTYDNTTITVQGVVSDPTNLLLVKYFTLTDDTGSIIVVTNHGLPETGKDLKVLGQVDQQFAIADLSFTVILEVGEPD